MEFSDPTTIELPSSDSNSETSEWFCPSPARSLPPFQYHADRHQIAGSLIVQLFEFKEAGRDRRIREVLNDLHSLNEDIRQLNAESGLDKEVGTIDVDIFLHAWEEPGSHPYLEEFCRLRHYPVTWACQPPEASSEYRPYKQRYWENCDLKTPGMLLRFVWEMRKATVKEDIIEDQELILLGFECDFNKGLRRLHQAHGNAGSVIGLLQSECLLEAYRMMVECLQAGEPERYEKHREDLRRDCVLFGYPQAWVPGDYEQEKDRA
ncbi:hypothetical protein Asppvi_005863 [Aspergillus pseudoviridinutans]|uniref:Uncharacterized protein n=1 Tax=Aspergillus pseudoviridinutans TaxID=1517512 RepID=A0A9P3ET50_9EURO|nr:uncharacterized protein Asppvi_005863 [Aspergillus pseudoviridinutans]GIJ86964.1 hypothetical protein Asppvi_005863 [Aspergillus pseudoviridinutans]